ncbi:MAG: site-2 protease family protein [Myxococcales bacterium]|nr:site-2 protease family protein [Myxococcales bacterium]MCB9644733.1 site-2 protease family protein [Myxococcales bacterium]
MLTLFRDPQYFVLLCLTMLISLTFHEFAHAWTAYKLNDDTAYREGRVTLNPIVHLDLMGSIVFLISGGFGWARPVPVNPTNFKQPRRDDILVTGAGPASNLLLSLISAGLLFALARFGGSLPAEVNGFLSHFFRVMVYVNLVLAFFNLIPLFPLDGSHIVTNLLPLNQAYRFKRFNEEYGGWTLMILIALPYFTQGNISPIGWTIRPLIEFFYRLLV